MNIRTNKGVTRANVNRIQKFFLALTLPANPYISKLCRLLYNINKGKTLILNRSVILMKGSIRKRGASWSYRVYVSTSCGKNKQIESGGDKTKTEAELALTKFVNDYEETGIYPQNKKITFNEVYEEFVEFEGKPKRAYATILAESGISPRYVQEMLGHLKLEFTLKYYTHNRPYGRYGEVGN